MQRSFGNPINKFQIKISYNEFLKQNEIADLDTILFSKLKITFPQSYFGRFETEDYYVVNFKYDVANGDFILDIVNKNYGES
jgi:hypothetical protein